MTRRKKLLWTAIVYFITIVIFATIYYSYWLINTSNFIINQDFNELTINPVFFSGEIPEHFESNNIQLTTRQANELMEPIFDSLTIYKQQIENLDTLIIINKKQNSILFSILWKSHNKNLESYLNKKLENNIKIKNDILAHIDDFRKRQITLLEKKQEYYKLEIEIAKLNYQLSLKDVSIAEITAEVYSEGLKDKINFYDNTLYEKSVILNNERIRLENLKSLTLEKVEKAKESIRTIDGNYHWNRFNKVEFFDFVYFSVITATSTGYGDILPNTKSIRIIVFIQIILSLLIFGLFLNWLTTKE